MPLDKAMGEIKGVFYQRYMDDWCVLTRSKSALRKVVKRTHKVMRDLKFHLHPLKTYIGKIARGFNFLAYYMDYQKILPSKETIRRFHERATALYETPQACPERSRRAGNNHHVPQFPRRRRRHTPKTAVSRDISEYLVNEAAPTNAYLEGVLQNLLGHSCTITGGHPCGDAEALRPMEKLAEIRYDHHRGICNLRAKLPALHVFLFHARISRTHHGCGRCWLGFISVHKQNLKVNQRNLNGIPNRLTSRTNTARRQFSYKLILDKLSTFSVVR